MYKKIMKIGIFILVLIILGGIFVKDFQFKYGDGIYPLQVFYEQESNSIDVMCFGSSHIFENVNTGVLWDEYGMASFNLCGSVQPLWNTYYYMKEALKTQSPKVMVLDVYGAVQTSKYTDDSRIIKNNYGLKLSMDKINSIKASAPKEKWLPYMLEYPTYHSRYTELSRTDFEKHLGIKNWENWKGFGINTATTPLQRPNVSNITEKVELMEKTETYLRKIIQLSKDNQIPLVLIKTPYSVSEDEQVYYNKVSDIAKEYHVPFINYNLLYDEIGVDFLSDFADASHLNHRGNTKFTNTIGKYLKENYMIPDRREDKGYESYNIMAEDCKRIVQNQKLKEIKDLNSYLDLVNNNEYLIVLSANGNYKNGSNYEEIKNKLKNLGIELEQVEKDSVWVSNNNYIEYVSVEENKYEWHMETNGGNTLMVSRKDDKQLPVIKLGYSEYTESDNAINMFIYDKVTDTLVENVVFDGNSGYIAIR